MQDLSENNQSRGRDRRWSNRGSGSRLPKVTGRPQSRTLVGGIPIGLEMADLECDVRGELQGSGSAALSVEGIRASTPFIEHQARHEVIGEHKYTSPEVPSAPGGTAQRQKDDARFFDVDVLLQEAKGSLDDGGPTTWNRPRLRKPRHVPGNLHDTGATLPESNGPAPGPMRRLPKRLSQGSAQSGRHKIRVLAANRRLSIEPLAGNQI